MLSLELRKAGAKPAFLRFAHRAAITLSSKEPRLVRSLPNQDQLDHPFRPAATARAR
jgi:hypothetical protein